jgi:hypothetical protein
MKRLISTFALIGLSFVLGTVIAQAQSAVDVTDNFYATLADLNIRGLPNKDQVREISPFLSSEVIALINRDQRKQRAFIKKHPYEKPPWIEGDLFSSLFEGRTGYEIGKTRKKGGTHEVDVLLTYDDGINKSKWTDTATLKRVAGKLVITNIIYKGKWQFKTGRSLLDVLR